MARRTYRQLEVQLAAARRRISELESRRVESLPGVDPVTGLLDLREFCLRLDVEMRRARRHERPVTVALMDIDHFGIVRARHGDRVAEGVISAVGRVLQRFLRSHDVAARAHNDEFALLLPETDLVGANRCLERVALEMSVLEVGPVRGISVSAGIAQPDGEPTATRLFHAAAVCLDRARAAGGGRFYGAPVEDEPPAAGHAPEPDSGDESDDHDAAA
jgi:diguanylate cyclase (GGDEF)-like protein